ncbi:hypothetical protein HNR10_001112 [Nocardiopsis aegyptia]|uniref:DOD-type homing endonuclease domain-containing protein n=1 Tax=Nocardiopsis aegyptia TaxID=220378 RepID=A0A7Z0EKD4_9ACTN|nr:hypothetical protein [Nocardiopsis aegyptia]
MDSGISYSEVSRRLGINRSTLRLWRTDRSLIEKYRDDVCPRCEPLPRPPAPADIYAYLLGLYLGDGSLNLAGDGSKLVWRLRIQCADAWPGLIEECANAFRTVRPAGAVGRVQGQGATEVHANWKHWPCLFPQHGPGKKHDRPIILSPWQQEIVDEHPQPLVRGLIHSDGCRTVNRIRRTGSNGARTVYEYPRYHFTNASTDIVGHLTSALDRLGIAWKSHTKATAGCSDQTVVSVSRKEAVARMDSFVGPKY